MMPFIGIDLGTTYSCVAALHRGQPEVIANEHGNRTTPSCVAFTNEKRLIGEAARSQMSKNAANTVYDVKRLMGRSFDEPTVQSDKRRWPFEVVDEGGKPKIRVEYKTKSRNFAPEEVSSAVLQHMKKSAEDYIGEGVLGAVITVPAYFNDAQRTATKDAAAIAELHVLGLLNEPTAAAIAYGLNKQNERTILIYDLGGGTFDVTILTIEEGKFRVKATSGDTHLGGQDFNDRVFKHFSSVIATEQGVDIKTNKRASSRLMTECEKAKKVLSTALRADIEIDALIQGEDFFTHITRARFEQLNEDLFKGTLETVGKALDDAGLDKDEIEEVVLVGGSTRIPRVRKLLADYFGETKICKTIHPDEAVALGAAIYAASLSGKTSSGMKQFTLEDVTPLSLGIETTGGTMSVVVPRNTTIPTEKRKSFITSKDNQNSVDFCVYEGERPNTERNHFLGKFTLRDITLAPAGKISFDTCFNIDKDGVLEVTAVERGGAQTGSVTIAREGREKNEEEIKRMIEEAREFREVDKAWDEQLKLENELEAATLSERSTYERPNSPVQSEEFSRRPRAIATRRNPWRLERASHLTLEELEPATSARLGDVE